MYPSISLSDPIRTFSFFFPPGSDSDRIGKANFLSCEEPSEEERGGMSEEEPLPEGLSKEQQDALQFLLDERRRDPTKVWDFFSFTATRAVLHLQTLLPGVSARVGGVPHAFEAGAG